MNLRKERERRAPRRFEDELEEIYAPEVPDRQVIRPATKPERPAFLVVPNKPFNPNLPPAAFPSLPFGHRQDSRRGETGQEHGAPGHPIDLTASRPEVAGNAQRPSLVVRFVLNKAEQHEVSLRELLKRVDTQQASRWTARTRFYAIPGFSDRQTLRQSGVTLNDMLEEQYLVHSTLISMEDDNDSTAPPSAENDKLITFSSLDPMVQSTIVANIHAAALRERFPDPFFPIQHLLDLPDDTIVNMLYDLDKSIRNDYYPDCLKARAMTPALLRAYRFLRQQGWPLRFLKPTTVSRAEEDRDLRPPYAPVEVGVLPPADRVFFGRAREVVRKDLNGAVLSAEQVRGLVSSGGSRVVQGVASIANKQVRSEKMKFADGRAQAELQRVRFGRQEKQEASRSQLQLQERARQDQRRRQAISGPRPGPTISPNSPPLSSSWPVTPYAAAFNAAAVAALSEPGISLAHTVKPASDLIPAPNMALSPHSNCGLTPPAEAAKPTPLPSSFLNLHSSPLTTAEPSFAAMFRNSTNDDNNPAIPALNLPPPSHHGLPFHQTPVVPHRQQHQHENFPPRQQHGNLANHQQQHQNRPSHLQHESSYHHHLHHQQTAQALAHVRSLQQNQATGAAAPPPTTTTATAMANPPPAVIPMAPMATNRTVRAHFAMPDRSNIMLPPPTPPLPALPVASQVGVVKNGGENGYVAFMRECEEVAERKE